MKKAVLTILYLLVAMQVVSVSVRADGEVVTTQVKKERVCHTQYGGGVICEDVETPVVVDTGVVENVILAGTMFAAGYIMLLVAKRVSQTK